MEAHGHTGVSVLHDVLKKWAAAKPAATAIINHDRKQRVDWATFDLATTALAGELLRMGFRKGDFLATSLPLLTGHIFLEYACFKIGVIHAPLDLRLKPAEVLRCLGQIRAKGFAFLSPDLGRAVQTHCPFVEQLIQFSPPQDTIQYARSFFDLTGDPPAPQAFPAIAENDPAQVIFTTGSTGAPKPALLSHRGILAQNLALATGFGFDEDSRVLVNLPPSHVGCQAELLMTTLFAGGTAVILELFDAAKSLAAIQEHRVNLLGQIPAMFNLEWRLSDYARYDLTSLKKAAYGGQQASRPFLDKLATMAPAIATGLGLTEASGFCTYTPLYWTPAQLAESIGHPMPLYPMTIRQAMREDGSAGDELPEGEIGHVCFRGPQTFLGYVNDPEATRRAISSDGYLYTGDLGSADSKGLHFAGRAKWLIKPAGYRVFPGEVENTICALDAKVASCGVVGAPHEVRVEAIVAFVEKKPGIELTVAELKRQARNMAAFMRPSHYVILEPGQMPLNRTAKIDYVKLSEMALEEVARLRAVRRWDR
jgi:acyl-CoA synthetase (AMP-forming)/AMP-acid ligase II